VANLLCLDPQIVVKEMRRLRREGTPTIAHCEKMLKQETAGYR
jgi:hypothetical protein